MLFVNFGALAQTSDFRIEGRGQVAFLYWMQGSKLGSLRHQIASRLNVHAQPDLAIPDQAKTWTQQPVHVLSAHSAHLTSLRLAFAPGSGDIRFYIWMNIQLTWCHNRNWFTLSCGDIHICYSIQMLWLRQGHPLTWESHAGERRSLYWDGTGIRTRASQTLIRQQTKCPVTNRLSHRVSSKKTRIR